MHTTTKKNLGRSTRARVVGHSSVSSPLCARRIGHRALLTRTECVCVCACVCVKTASVSACTSGTKSCANTSLPAGDIIALDPEQVTVRHFVSAILFARYFAGYFDLDALRSLRYLFACMPTYTRPSSITCECFANSDERCGRVEISKQHTTPSSVGIIFHERVATREIASLRAASIQAVRKRIQMD